MDVVAVGAEEHEGAGHQEFDVVGMGGNRDGGLHEDWGQESGDRSQEPGTAKLICNSECRKWSRCHSAPVNLPNAL